jgi:hypothetical protein
LAFFLAIAQVLSETNYTSCDHALMRFVLSPLLRPWFSWLLAMVRWRGVVLALVAAFLLTGCVDSDVAIRFYSPQRGEIVQQIQVDQRLASLSGEGLQQWWRAIARSAQSVGGTLLQPTSLRSGSAFATPSATVMIPFSSSRELEEKFNQFFATVLTPPTSSASKSVDSQSVDSLASGGLPRVVTPLSVLHSNFLLVERVALDYEADLRSLGVQSAQGSALVSTANLVHLSLRLATPWGATSSAMANHLRSQKAGHDLVWKLVPGEQNSLKATFWLPSPLGIGALIIGGGVLLGRRIKYPAAVVAPSSWATDE